MYILQLPHDQFICAALTQKASDIHIQPEQGGARIRLRIDGILADYAVMSTELASQVITRLKVAAQLDISCFSTPQDGRFSLTHDGRTLDVRVATVPSVFGEKMVLRLLDNRSSHLTLEQLGFSKQAITTITHEFLAQKGCILATGPTGAGKSTTLYALLRLCNPFEQNIMTLEDPIEYRIEGIVQRQIKSTSDSFAGALRALLRQDPDTILIGEMRDSDTAHTALTAALTGHLVVSSLHTNDALSGVLRLCEMGIPPYLVAATVRLIIAQRLVRKICRHCAYFKAVTRAEQVWCERYGVSTTQILRGAGCVRCHGRGTQGRLVIPQILVMNDTLGQLLQETRSYSQLASCAQLPSLAESAAQCMAREFINIDDVIYW